MQKYTIKPLKWKKSEDGRGADTGVPKVYVVAIGDLYDPGFGKPHKTLEKAKAAAEKAHIASVKKFLALVKE